MDMKVCQSCGMPMHTEEIFGTEANGGKNQEYCIYCFKDGAFQLPNVTMEQMMEICIPFMKEHGMPEEQARAILKEQLPKLKRWRTS